MVLISDSCTPQLKKAFLVTETTSRRKKRWDTYKQNNKAMIVCNQLAPFKTEQQKMLPAQLLCKKNPLENQFQQQMEDKERKLAAKKKMYVIL